MLTLPNEELRRLRKRFLKPLLAPALLGEPWKPALTAGETRIDPHVVAACVVSYASRADTGWAHRDTWDLLRAVKDAATADCGRFDRDQWPFVHALARMLRTGEWDAVAPLVRGYQQRYSASVGHVDRSAPV